MSLPSAFKRYRANASIVLADKDTYMRQSLRNAFTAEGYRNFRTVGRISSLRELIVASAPDLLILDADTPDGGATELIMSIRGNKLPVNPFLPIILTIWDSEASRINQAANSGADFILMKPISPTRLFGRIERLVVERKPFIATETYTGPDRRADKSRDQVRQYEVPNTLKDKLEGRPINDVSLAEQIEKSVRQLEDSRLEQATKKLVAETELACAALKEGDDGHTIDCGLSDVMRIAQRINKSTTGDIRRLSQLLLNIGASIRQKKDNVALSTLDLLLHLAHSMLLAANPDIDATEAIDEITRTVSRFEKQDCAPQRARSKSKPELVGASAKG